VSIAGWAVERQLDPRVTPYPLADGCHLGVRQERCNQPWNHDDNELPPIGAGEREEMVAADALDSERVIHA
jgi:hypothetical protein